MILGAGLTGLLAAHIFQKMPIYEGAQAPAALNTEILRFTTKKLSALTGIEFEPVQVHYGIFGHGVFSEPNIFLANAYTRKLYGQAIDDRAIWNLESKWYYVPPENFCERLIENVGNRLNWGVPFEAENIRMARSQPIISTFPLPVMANALGLLGNTEFPAASTHQLHFRVPHCNVHQTIYFPAADYNLFTASLCGNLLTCAFIGEPIGDWQNEVMTAFCIGDAEPIGAVEVPISILSPVDSQAREILIEKMAKMFGVYSFGRLAQWRSMPWDALVSHGADIRHAIVNGIFEQHKSAV